MNPNLQRIAVALPILLLAFIAGRAEWHLDHSETWHFAIRGYDPRDLLRGHYMTFRLDISPSEIIAGCALKDPECCYCLEASDDLEAKTVLTSCDMARTTCDAFVRTQPLHSFDRFYIPEDGRREMEQTLRSAAREDRALLAVAVSASGEPMIEGLLVDGVPIEAVGSTD